MNNVITNALQRSIAAEGTTNAGDKPNVEGKYYNRATRQWQDRSPYQDIDDTPPKPKPTISLVLQLSHDHRNPTYLMGVQISAATKTEVKLTQEQFDYLHRMCNIEPSLRILKEVEEGPKD